MTDEELIAACKAVDDDEEIQQLMKVFECCSADGLDGHEQEDAASALAVAALFAARPKQSRT